MVTTKQLKLSDFEAATFDVYGTIVNWEPEIARFLRTWVDTQAVRIDTSTLLSLYDQLRQPIQNRRPAYRYPQVLKLTLEAMAEQLKCPLPAALRAQFGEIAGTHKPFPDSRDALLGLQARGLKLGALSNIDEASFARMMKILRVPFDVVVTAERVGAYKPDKTHFLTALSDLLAMGITPDKVLHVAQSRRADIVPANALGLTCVWVNRQGHIFGRHGDGAEDAHPDYEVSSLAALLDH